MNPDTPPVADRTVASITTAQPQPGSGILHPFPTADLPHIDPFVFLDTGAPMDLSTGDIYVGPHSHRGVQPVSLLFRGRIEHRDSLGNHRTITSGGMQWLVAGSGALHEEVLHGDEDGVFHMAQLWVNVPAELKMAPAEHHAVPAEDVPTITGLGTDTTIRLYAGSIDDATGPAPLPTPVLVTHVVVDAGGSVTLPVDSRWSASFCVVAGSIDIAGHDRLEPGATPMFAHDGGTITMSSGTGGEFLLMAGQPIDEPIAMGGGFVMNTTDEIRQAFDDERAGRFGRLEPSR